jgi:phosphoserine aminotransferase
VENENHRSATVMVLNCKEGSSKVISTIKERSDMIIGAGYGKLKETQIRIANFPAVNLDQVQSLIAELGSL